MAMSKKRLLAVTFISILLASMLHGTQLVNVARAAPDAPRIFLQSPQSRVYASNYVPLELTANSSNTPNENVFFVSIVYYVDGQERGDQHSSLPFSPYYGAIMHLSTGTHTIQVNASAQAYTIDSYTIVYSPISYFDSGKVVVTVNPAPSSSPSTKPSPSIMPSITPRPSPTPTMEPTMEPTSTPEQQTGFLGTGLSMDYGYLIVAAIIVVVVLAVAAIVIKKRR